jgi:hypothetical protein
MKRRIKLTESELIKLITRVINEQDDEMDSDLEDWNANYQNELNELYRYKKDLYDMAGDIIDDNPYMYELDDLAKAVKEVNKRSAHEVAKELMRVDREIKDILAKKP